VFLCVCVCVGVGVCIEVLSDKSGRSYLLVQ